MRIVVLDTETTGMGDADQVLELAFVSWQHGEVREIDRWSSLIKPTCPVSTGAKAVHHVSDAMLADAWTFEEMIRRRGLPEINQLGEDQEFDEYTKEDVVVAAHNFAFDARMLTQTAGLDILPDRRICTWRCAMHLYPDSPDGHSNQVLRYYLDLEVPEVTGLPPHRALPDAVVTAALLQHMLKSKTPEQLIALTLAPVMLKTVRFGKHKGTEWKNLDSGYLNWILSKDFDTDAHHTARTVLEGRRQPLLRR